MLGTVIGRVGDGTLRKINDVVPMQLENMVDRPRVYLNVPETGI